MPSAYAMQSVSGVNYSTLPIIVLTLLLFVLSVLFIAICTSTGSMYYPIAIHSFSQGTRLKAFEHPEKL